MSTDIRNRTALVTGANRGIGRAIVESFINHGAQKVYLAVRDIRSTEHIVEQFGDRVVALQVDIANEDSVRHLASEASDVDIVVNNAGILETGAPSTADFKQSFQRQVDVNVFGLVHMAQAFSPVLVRRKGAFVQLNSVASLVNMTVLTSYAASKAAAYSITQGLRELLGQQGVHVLSVHPGATDTQMLKNMGFDGYAEPVDVVSEGIVAALSNGDFFLFPGKESERLGRQYRSFADNVITAENA